MLNHFKPLTCCSLGDVAQIIQAELDPRWNDRSFGPLSTDSRNVNPGEYFLALRGESFDGHRFCELAMAGGAAGLIVDRDFSAGESLGQVPLLRVENTLRAYGDLAAARRRQWGGPLLAISGSAGKTTTRRMVAESIRPHHCLLEPIKNYNNLIGVPYTLLGLQAEHQLAILELGMNMPGELRRLTEIASPSAALLTRIDLTHVGMFPSAEALVQAKLDLFRGCAAGTPLVINAGCPRLMGSLDEFAGRHPLVYFLGEGQAVRNVSPAVLIKNVTPLLPIGYQFDCQFPGGERKGLTLRMFGRHHLQNVAAAAALLHAAGLPPEWVVEALDGFHTEPLRGEVIRTQSYAMILDCYNASPPSMLGALDSLAEFPCAGRRVLVLADMLELGSHSPAAHDLLLEPLRRLAPALFLGLGPQCARLAGQLAAEGWEAHGFLERQDLIRALQSRLTTGDQIFFKGSHGFGLEKVAQEIMASTFIIGNL